MLCFHSTAETAGASRSPDHEHTASSSRRYKQELIIILQLAHFMMQHSRSNNDPQRKTRNILSQAPTKPKSHNHKTIHRQSKATRRTSANVIRPPSVVDLPARDAAISIWERSAMIRNSSNQKYCFTRCTFVVRCCCLLLLWLSIGCYRCDKLQQRSILG